MRFWENCQKLLAERGITSRALARAVEVSPTTLSKYGRGTVPGLDVAIRIAEYFGVSMDSLIWGQADNPTSRLCPSPGDHQLLQELLVDMGLDELRQMSRLSSQAIAWDIAKTLAARFPHPIALDELYGLFKAEPEETIRASLLVLRRRAIVAETISSAGPEYTLLEHVPWFSAGEAGDLSQHIKTAVRLLITAVFSALERRDGSAHLLTLEARISPEAADRMVRELHTFVKMKIAEYSGMEVGEEKVHLVFGIGTEKQL